MVSETGAFAPVFYYVINCGSGLELQFHGTSMLSQITAETGASAIGIIVAPAQVRATLQISTATL